MWLNVADFNRDGQLDIAIANYNVHPVDILLGYGNGSFASFKTYSAGYGSLPMHLDVGDFNNDNISDIVVANSGSNNVLFLYGDRNGTFGNDTSYPFGYKYQPYSIAAAHLNEDNWMDLVIPCYGTDHVETLTKICSD